jgi:hypothetical protein
VAKPAISRTTGAISFWEHKALAVRVERAADTWFLALLPSYVFTLDGLERPIDRDRIGQLTTRRASRDYNASVRHDLAFWRWVISGGEDVAFNLRGTGEGISHQSIQVSAQLPLISAAVLKDTADDGDIRIGDSDDLEDVQREIEELVDAEIEDAATH